MGSMILPLRSMIILSQLANCLYDSGSDITRTCQQPAAADTGVAQTPYTTLPRAGGRRPCERWRVRRLHRQKTAGDPAYGQRASAHSFASRANSRQADQEVDFLQAQRDGDRKDEAAHFGKNLSRRQSLVVGYRDRPLPQGMQSAWRV